MKYKTAREILFVLSIVIYAVFLFLLEKKHLIYFGVDWRETYYPATKLFLAGQNPYQVTTLHNPIWGLIPLAPMALVGEGIGEAVMFFVAFGIYIYVAWKLGASRIALAMFIASPLVAYNLMLGNIDWIVAIGFILPPSIGLFLVLLKPQIGIAVALYWLWKGYQSGGIKEVVKTFYPVTLSVATSFLLFGNWLTGKSDNLMGASWNLSLFPYSIPVGMILLYMAYRKYGRAIAASPFYSPYLSLGSWSIAQLGMVDNDLFTFVVTVSLWMLYAAARFINL